MTSEDAVVSKVGRDLYDKFFRGYTRKQWGLDPSELDASVAARVPTRTNRDDRYFTDTYQAMPLHGYTRMFEAMLRHPNIKVMLNTDYREVADLMPWKHMIYTGPIDAFFDYRYGKLPYRSLEFQHVTRRRSSSSRWARSTIPNDYALHARHEFKHLTGQVTRTLRSSTSTRAQTGPLLPGPAARERRAVQRYEADAEAQTRVTFVGRLATYRTTTWTRWSARRLRCSSVCETRRSVNCALRRPPRRRNWRRVELPSLIVSIEKERARARHKAWDAG